MMIIGSISHILDSCNAVQAQFRFGVSYVKVVADFDCELGVNIFNGIIPN